MGSALLGALLAAGRSAAQSGPVAPQLTVHPREAATGTRNEKAGVFQMRGLSLLYVPPKCVGTQRCPLWVHYPDWDPNEVLDLLRPIMDEFGFLLLVTNAGGGWEMRPSSTPC